MLVIKSILSLNTDLFNCQIKSVADLEQIKGVVARLGWSQLAGGPVVYEA